MHRISAASDANDRHGEAEWSEVLELGLYSKHCAAAALARRKHAQSDAEKLIACQCVGHQIALCESANSIAAPVSWATRKRLSPAIIRLQPFVATRRLPTDTWDHDSPRSVE